MSRTCNLCGKQFNLWDERQDFSFDRHVGYGSKYARKNIALNLCCNCFDKVIDWLLPQCAVDPMRGECESGLPIKALLEGDFVAEVESLMHSLPATQHLRYGFRRMWLHEWQGVYVVSGMGYCTDPCIRLPRSIEMTVTYGGEKQVHRVPVGEVGKRAFACERRLEGAVLTAVTEIGAEAFDECCSLRWLWLPRTLRRIGPAAFRGCKNLEAILFEGTEEEFKKIVIDTAQKDVSSPDKGLTFEEYEVKHLGNEPFLNAKVYYNFPLVKSAQGKGARDEKRGGGQCLRGQAQKGGVFQVSQAGKAILCAL